ncbi:MAG: hypothetical protein Q9164_000387 [Protoblastenia rupestris]
MYTSSQKQQRLRHVKSINQEKQEKANRRASKQVTPSTDVENTQLKRRTSRLGLFGLFNRSRSSEVEPPETKLHIPWEGDEGDEGEGTTEHQKDAEPEDLSPQGFVPDQEPQPETAESGSIRHRASKRALKTKGSFTMEMALKKHTTWEPPPLFQAYPQSVKHATLPAPAVGVEAVIRLNNERQYANAKHIDSNSVALGKQRERRLKKVSGSEMVSKRDWTEKVYVLVTEGYILQYSGHGAHDRLPEKIMPLSKDSAAFASDAIPGKHYVLQISQILRKDGTVDPEISRSMLKKAGLKNEMKRSASTFLLVLKDPEEMNAWLVAVRKEIEALGGKEYRPEIFGTDGLGDGTVVEPAQRMQRMPSERYLVKREPHRFSRRPWEPPPDVTLGNCIYSEEKPIKKAETAASSPANRLSLATQESIVSPYISNTTASIDQVHLDRLKGSPRQSYASTGPKTASTSRTSSMDHSPVMERFDPILEANVAPSRRGSYNIGVYRKSIQQTPIEINGRDSDQSTPTPYSRSRSAGSLVTTPTTMQAASPAPPNFSVPTFSKRFSMNSNSPPASIKAQTPPIIVQADKISPQPDILIDEGEMQSDRDSLVGEMMFRPTSSSRASQRVSTSTQHDSRLGPPPKSCDSKISVEGQTRFSRRQSSLEYARGISPVKSLSHSPSPHPPPTNALPPVPDYPDPKRASLIPPPTCPLPPVPDDAEQHAVLLSPPITVLSAVPGYSAPSEVVSSLSSSTTPSTTTEAPCKLRRPVSMQVRQKPPSPSKENFLPLVTAVNASFSLEEKPDGALLPAPTSPPKPTHKPPPPPSHPPPAPPSHSPPKTLSRKSMPQLLGPADPATQPAMPVIGVHERTAASCAFIPPLNVSERRSRGSLDGPWNADYGAHKKAFYESSFA